MNYSIKKVYIIGNRGNMGSRYAACLNELGVPHMGSDYGEQIKLRDCDAVIVATPTNTHEQILHELSDSPVPILCEKPIMHNIERLEMILDRLNRRGIRLTMVNQYRFLTQNTGEEGGTYYNYFRTGGDGLGWDCINIVGLARGDVLLKNQSPIWKCAINGYTLNISEMDNAYVHMLDDWLKDPRGNERYLVEAHKKVRRLYGDRIGAEGTGGRAGKVDILKATGEELKGPTGVTTC